MPAGTFKEKLKADRVGGGHTACAKAQRSEGAWGFGGPSSSIRLEGSYGCES